MASGFKVVYTHHPPHLQLRRPLFSFFDRKEMFMLRTVGMKVSFAGIKVEVDDECDLCTVDECPSFNGGSCPNKVKVKGKKGPSLKFREHFES
ncbi:MAG: hypothetical protein ABIH63_04145 [archaeon]